MSDLEPIHVYIPADPSDPRVARDLPAGVVGHFGPRLHPDDVTVVDGIPVTSVSRTLIDMAEEVDKDELRGLFAAARARGLLDAEQLVTARARVEWRRSLPMLDEVIAEFC